MTIFVHEDHSDYLCDCDSFYFSDGKDMQSGTYCFSDTVDQIKFLKEIGIVVDTSLTNYNWDLYI